MKIQCDVCNKKESSVFCIADEAALCDDCDHRVHHVNKLAGKHQRFSLLQPSPKQIPLCDICQERRGFLFCQQDRAILCRECDVPIHKTNEHTQKHNRYLLTGIKLSTNSLLYSSTTPSKSTTSSANSVPNQNPICCKTAAAATAATVSVSSSSVSTPISCSNKTAAAAAGGHVETVKTSNNKDNKVVGCNNNGQLMNNVVGNGSMTSSISEYLEMLPGWHVEDFLDCATPHGFSKVGDEETFSFWDSDLESQLSTFKPQENIGLWVPQAPPLLQQSKQQIHNQYFPPTTLNFGGQIGLKDTREITSNNKSSRKWNDDNSFAVPQISPPSTSIKRSRIYF